MFERRSTSATLALCLGLASCAGESELGEAAARRSGALTSLSAGADHEGAHPGVLRAGRFASVAIDPTNAAHAVAVADAGGVYVSNDGGATWETSLHDDGSVGAFGHGFAGTKINLFYDVTFSPDGKTLLLLAGRGNSFAAKGGVWRSTDGGKHWSRPTNPSPSDALGDKAHVAYSPTTGMAYVIGGQQLGISSDDGASWTWSDPFMFLGVAFHAPLYGLDIFPRSELKNPFGESAASGGSDVLAFCMTPELNATDHPRLLVFYNVRNGKTLVSNAPPLGPFNPDGGYCQVAFDPNNSLHVFVASHASQMSGIAEGIVTPGQQGGTLWTDLAGASSKNGRPTFVQARRKSADTVTVYYHSATHLYQQDCPSTGACTPGQWKQTPVVHADSARIAFDPQGKCPLLIAGDGGLERSGDCGATWDANISGPNAMEAWTASFAGQGLEKVIFLNLQDNGTFFSRLTDADLQSPLPGEGISWLPWFERDTGDGRWSEQWRTDPGTAVAASNTKAPRLYQDLRKATPTITTLLKPPSGTPLMRNESEYVGAFVAPGVFAMPVLNGDDRLEMWFLDVNSGKFTQVGNPSMKVPTPSGKTGRIAVAGGTGGDPSTTVFVIQGGVLWVWSGLGWTIAGGPKSPIEVWGDTVDRSRAFVLDGKDDSVWKPKGGVFLFQKDVGLSQLATDNGNFAGLPSGGCPHQVCSVAFDPKDPNKIAVGTSHAGILFSGDGGASWSKSGAVPEPAGGVRGLYFDSPAGAKGENGLAVIWGRGVWAVNLVAAKIKMPGPGDTSGKIVGNLFGVDDAPVSAAALRVRVADLCVLERRYAAAAAAETRDDPQSLIEELDPEDEDEGAETGFKPVTVPLLAYDAPRPLPPPAPPAPEPSEVVADFPAPTRTDERGGFSIALPQLAPGRYYVQVIYAGDELNPSTTAGTEYDVGCETGACASCLR